MQDVKFWPLQVVLLPNDSCLPIGKQPILVQHLKNACYGKIASGINENQILFKQKKLNDTAYILEFSPENSGLKTSDNNEPKGFKICGMDSVFVPANAIIRENKVILWSKKIPHPTGVSYLWENNPAEVNLTNKNGIPVCPFISY